MKTDTRIKKIIKIAILITLVVVFSYMRIPLLESSVHLGNGMCLLSGLLLSPVVGGFVAGFGSMIYDIYAYPSIFAFEFIITFFTKFMMAFVCGMSFSLLKRILVSESEKKVNLASIVISCIIGQSIYIFLYLLKSFLENIFIIGTPIELAIPLIVGKLIPSLLNAFVAILMASILYRVIKKIDM